MRFCGEVMVERALEGVASDEAGRGAAGGGGDGPATVAAGAGVSRTISRGGLSSRRPRNTAWRTWRVCVQPAKATSASSCGLTQCALRPTCVPSAKGLRSAASERSSPSSVVKVRSLKPEPTLPA